MRCLIAYNNKLVLLANLVNGDPNLNTHAYGHYSLPNHVHAKEADVQAAAGNYLQIVSREKREEARLQRKRAVAIKRARCTQPLDISDDKAGVQFYDLIIAQRTAVARPGFSVRINTVIDRICSRAYLDHSTSPPLRSATATTSTTNR